MIFGVWRLSANHHEITLNMTHLSSSRLSHPFNHHQSIMLRGFYHIINPPFFFDLSYIITNIYIYIQHVSWVFPCKSTMLCLFYRRNPPFAPLSPMVSKAPAPRPCWAQRPWPPRRSARGRRPPGWSVCQISSIYHL